jgi:hypothetical protein
LALETSAPAGNRFCGLWSELLFFWDASLWHNLGPCRIVPRVMEGPV